jgi:hypothetical protein
MHFTSNIACVGFAIYDFRLWLIVDASSCLSLALWLDPLEGELALPSRVSDPRNGGRLPYLFQSKWFRIWSTFEATKAFDARVPSVCSPFPYTGPLQSIHVFYNTLNMLGELKTGLLDSWRYYQFTHMELTPFIAIPHSKSAIQRIGLLLLLKYYSPG